MDIKLNVNQLTIIDTYRVKFDRASSNLRENTHTHDERGTTGFRRTSVKL